MPLNVAITIAGAKRRGQQAALQDAYESGELRGGQLMKRAESSSNAPNTRDAPWPIDQHAREQAFDLGRQRLNFEGPLAYFRNQSNVAALADLMEANFGLTADLAIPQIRNVQNAADAYR